MGKFPKADNELSRAEKVKTMRSCGNNRVPVKKITCSSFIFGSSQKRVSYEPRVFLPPDCQQVELDVARGSLVFKRSEPRGRQYYKKILLQITKTIKFR